MRLKLFVLMSILTLTLTGCFDKSIPIETTHTVNWFMAHDTRLQQTLTRCSNNPAKYRKQPNCINALQAATQLSAGELHPIDWH